MQAVVVFSSLILLPMLQIGDFNIDPPVILAPMAGVTDRPFRQLCRRMGAGMAVSEMVSSNPALFDSEKSRLRRDHEGESEPRVVQIAGAEPDWIAQAARFNVDEGAQIIDINMGCPAKKVCKKAAGSALLADPDLVGRILYAAVAAVEVPVTLKIRTGTCPDRRNALEIARIAEQAGIAALTIHGRTRADAYRGEAEYDSIAAVKSAISIPVIANGDVDSPEKMRLVLEKTGADAVMIGRAAQGRPWLFRELSAAIRGESAATIDAKEIQKIMAEHIHELHEFYGSYRGMLVARKHIGWYLATLPNSKPLKKALMKVDDPGQQLKLLESLCGNHAEGKFWEQAA